MKKTSLPRRLGILAALLALLGAAVSASIQSSQTSAAPAPEAAAPTSCCVGGK